MTYTIDPELAHAGDYSSWFLWPMFAFQVYPGNVLNTYHWRAVDVSNVVVWRGWFTDGGKDDPVIRELAVQDRKTTVAEDIRLVESVQRGLGFARIPAGAPGARSRVRRELGVFDWGAAGLDACSG